MKRVPWRFIFYLGILVAAFFLLRPHVHFLQSYEGYVYRLEERTRNTLIDGESQYLTTYYLIVATPDGGRRRVEVPYLLYARAREGMVARKRVFHRRPEVLKSE